MRRSLHVADGRTCGAHTASRTRRAIDARVSGLIEAHVVCDRPECFALSVGLSSDAEERESRVEPRMSHVP